MYLGRGECARVCARVCVQDQKEVVCPLVTSCLLAAGIKHTVQIGVNQ